MRKNYYNVIVVGHTGAGKSELINYLFQKDVAPTGVGESVTRDFDRYEAVVGELPIQIWDSRGCETDRVEAWREELRAKLHEYGGDLPPEQWLHAIIYCINSAESRVENFHVDVCKQLDAANESFVVVFTKKDAVDRHDADQLRDRVHDAIRRDVPCVSVCSARKQLEYAEGKFVWTEPYGAERLKIEIVRTFWRSIVSSERTCIADRIADAPRHAARDRPQRFNRNEPHGLRRFSCDSSRPGTHRATYVLWLSGSMCVLQLCPRARLSA
jgi:predicted GTPase